MKKLFQIGLTVFLVACQPQSAQIIVHILDEDRLFSVQTAHITPAAILSQAGITLTSTDKILFNGAELPVDFSMPDHGSYNLQIRRSHTLTLLSPDASTTFETTAATIGQALEQTGLQLFHSDYLEPPAHTPIKNAITVTYRPARDLIISADGGVLNIKSSARTIGQALAWAGIPLIGLDKSSPDESLPLPHDGQITVIRVSETITLVEKNIPYSQKYEYSSNVPAGTQKVLQAGEPGLAISRVRIRYENGVEVARTNEAETLVRQPKDSLVSLSSQFQVLTLNVAGGEIQYWHAVQMYATAYSPCRSGTSKCYYGTASGLPVKKGVVAVTRALYNQLAGSQVYIAGYGQATIADVGGGFPDGRLWIDLGYSDDDYQSWSGLVTVYFLAPAPASIPSVLQ